MVQLYYRTWYQVQVYRVGWVCASMLVTGKGAPDVSYMYGMNYHAPLQRSLYLFVFMDYSARRCPLERVTAILSIKSYV